MKVHNAVIRSAKITNMVSAILMSLCGIALLILSSEEYVLPQRILLGVLFFLTGGAKIFGFYSNDLYRLAFQFDFAIGILCEVLALLIFLTPGRAFDALPLLLAVYVTLDALLKTQMAFDARRFGMKSWVAIFVTGLVLCCIGVFAVYSVLRPLLTPVASVGLALIMDGAENVWITAHTVRIRAKKKQLFEQFGMSEE